MSHVHVAGLATETSVDCLSLFLEVLLYQGAQYSVSFPHHFPPEQTQRKQMSSKKDTQSGAKLSNSEEPQCQREADVCSHADMNWYKDPWGCGDGSEMKGI